MGASFERGSILGLFLGLSSIPKDPRNPEVSDCGAQFGRSKYSSCLARL